MISRRDILVGTFGAAYASQWGWAFGQDQDVVAAIPEEVGLADFGGIWETAPGTEIQLVAAVPDLPKCAQALSRLIRSADDAEQIFSKVEGFTTWFNEKVAGKKSWTDKRMMTSSSDFTGFWNQFTSDGAVSLGAFVAYMSVFGNEVAGVLKNRQEGFGANGHPGIAYLFDRVTLKSPDGKRKWTKRSYNTGNDNRTCLDLFNDSKFMNAHGSKKYGNDIAFTKNEVWARDVYPAGQFSTSGDTVKSGVILEADFFKFRGRGLIQTTWRSNYRKIVKFIRSYGGQDSVMKETKQRWSDMGSDDDVCTLSSAADWDMIFSDSGKVVLCEAIRLHAASSNYSTLSNDDGVLNGAGVGSIRFMGKSIGGSDNYGWTLKARFRELIIAMQADGLI